MTTISYKHSTVKLGVASALGLLVLGSTLLFVPEKLQSQTTKGDKVSNTTSDNSKLMEVPPVPMALGDGNASKEFRAKRALRYDSVRGEDLYLQRDGEIFARVIESPETALFPVKVSDAIVVGSTVGTQPFLSQSRTSIYTENSISIERVLMAKTAKIELGASIIAISEAGVLAMPDGKVLRYRVVGKPALLRLNERYLLFLKRNADTNDFDIVGGFWLGENEIVPIHPTHEADDFRITTEADLIVKVNKFSDQ